MDRSGRVVGQVWKTVVVAAAFFLGAIFAIGSLLAVMFEADGFGTPRDEQSRPAYLLLYALALAASVAGPFVVMRLVIGRLGREAYVYGLIALGVAFALFGMAIIT